MKTFENLEFNKHPATIPAETKQDLIAKGMDKDSDIFSEMKQAKITFDNGKFMSIIFGKMFYSNGVDTYEAWCSEIDDEPKGYLTKNEVTEYMKIIQEL